MIGPYIFPIILYVIIIIGCLKNGMSITQIFSQPNMIECFFGFLSATYVIYDLNRNNLTLLAWLLATPVAIIAIIFLKDLYFWNATTTNTVNKPFKSRWNPF